MAKITLIIGSKFNGGIFKKLLEIPHLKLQKFNRLSKVLIVFIPEILRKLSAALVKI